MVAMFLGPPGCAKSLHALWRICKTKRKRIVTNLTLTEEGLAFLKKQGKSVHYYTEDLTIKDRWWEVEHDDCLFVIDEAQRIYDQHTHSSPEVRDLQRFLSTSRKENADIIFITQHPKWVVNSIHRVTEFFVWHVDMRKRRVLWGSRGTAHIKASYFTGPGMTESLHDGNEFVRIGRPWIDYYRTMLPGRNPERVEVRGRSPWWIPAIIVVVIGVFLALAFNTRSLSKWALGRMLGVDEPSTNSPTAVIVGDVTPSLAPITPQRKLSLGAGPKLNTNVVYKWQWSPSLDRELMTGWYQLGGRIYVADPEWREAFRCKVTGGILHYLDTNHTWQQWK